MAILLRLCLFISATCAAESATTTVTAENYALAETQVIFTDYVGKISKATGTGGVGVFMHVKKAHDATDRTVMRPNFDTIYSMAMVDLTTEATLVMPDTGGRYQNAWIITEEHYNPFAFSAPGTYKLNEVNVGTKYAFIIMRTQVNTQDKEDLAIAGALQDKLVLQQAAKGSYVQSHKWDMDEILALRPKYMKIVKDKGLGTEVLFGKKGADYLTLENHNCGTAFGWGGFTKDQAVYLTYYPTSKESATLTLKDVPIPKHAFWSVTVYDKEGYVRADSSYNINSAFAKADSDGSVTIHFGGDKSAPNYMDIYEGWLPTLRVYLPTEAYFSKAWIQPELAYSGKQEL